MKSSAVTAFLLAATAASSSAFTSPAVPTFVAFQTQRTTSLAPAFLSDKSKEQESAVFIPATEEEQNEELEEDDISIDAVEKLGKGAAKVRIFNENIYARLIGRRLTLQIIKIDTLG